MITKRTKNVAVFSFLFLIVSGVTLAFTVHKIISSGTELENQSAIVANNAILQKKYTNLLSTLKQTEQERGSLAAHLFVEDQTVGFLTDIDQLAKKRGIELTTDSIKVVEIEGENFNDLVFQFTIQGPESRVKNMIQILETLPYHGNVTRLTLVKKGAASGFSGSVELTLSLLAYD